jgi:Aerotolerance regulator N-terminal/von Willebrand factor type A domain
MMNFLAPAFFAGIAAIAVPVIIHLINRERKVVIEFPSLMFLQRIPYRSVRRQKLRHLLLLALRCLALAIVVAAFARPFFVRRHVATAPGAGAREVIVLLDNSASMGYGDRWQRARDAARRAVAGLSAADRATLVVFANDARVASDPTSSADRMGAVIGATNVSAEGTRYGPALKLASQLVSGSNLPRKEVVIISDFQRVGWSRHDEVVFAPGTTLTPIDLGVGVPADVAVTQVSTNRSGDAGAERERVTVGARLTNVGASARPVAATLELGGRRVQTVRVTVPASGAEQVAFSPIPIPGGATRGAVRITPDSLTRDDVLNFTIAPDEAVSVLIVEPAVARTNQSLFLNRALAIGDRPSFRIDTKRIEALTPHDLDGRALIVLDEVVPPGGDVGARLRSLLSGGGGIVIAPGDVRTERWPAEWRALLPAQIGGVTDRSADAGGTLSWVDYAHPIFELFNAPRSGDFSTARFYRYRTLIARGDTGVIARFDDGTPAMVERTVGQGKLVLWGASLDLFWTNLPLQPVFLPFIHQLARHVGRYSDPRPWFVAGDVLDLSRHGELTAPLIARSAADSAVELILEAPSHQRERIAGARGGAGQLVTLREQGFYELRGLDTPVGSGRPIAVNVDPSEADLSHLDPQELIAAVTAGVPSGTNADVNVAAPQDQERGQKVWWYLLLGALLILAAETAWSNRLSRASS